LHIRFLAIFLDCFECGFGQRDYSLFLAFADHPDGLGVWIESIGDCRFQLNLHADFDGPVAKLSAKPLNRFARCWIRHLNYRPLNMTDVYHPLRFDIPNLQTQTTDDFHRIERGGFGRLQFGYLLRTSGNR
jgi:hypothetical protein